MYTCENIFTHHTLVEHDSILIVVTLPRHVSNEQVLTQCQFSVLGRITFSENLSLHNPLALTANRTKVNGHTLVGTTEFGNAILLEGWLKANKLFFLSAVIQDTDSGSIYIFHHTITLCGDHRTRIFTELTLDTCTHNGSFGTHQRHSLAHHV